MDNTYTLGTSASNMFVAGSPHLFRGSYTTSKISEKDSPFSKKMYSSSFKNNGARFSLNFNVNNSPKIFMR